MKTTPDRKVLPRCQRGVSLVEMMIAITVGLVLTAGVIQVFVSNKQIYRVQEALARLQENGRFAVDFLTRDLQGTGYIGCAGPITYMNNTEIPANGYGWDFSTGIQGFLATSSGALLTLPLSPSDLSITAPGTTINTALGVGDVITLRHPVGNPMALTAAMVSGTADVLVAPPNPASSGPAQEDFVMVSDCRDSAIFKVTSDPSTGTLSHAADLGKAYITATEGVPAEAVKMATTTYYIAPGLGTSGLPALWRQDGANPAQELVEGVQDMQIRYGVDTGVDRVPNQYLQANAVTDFNNVVSVRVDLLLQSIEDNLTNAPPRYTYNGDTCPGDVGCPTDRRYRQVFGATIGLRNELL